MLVKNALYSQTVHPVVEKGLDAATLRSKAIANNLANITTPQYRRIDVSFEEKLKYALDKEALQAKTSQPNHIPAGRPDISRVFPQAYRSEDPTNPGEVNNVDIDMEMSKLSSNFLAYRYGIKSMQNFFSVLTNVIQGKSS
jgi:flagellar basal-body rod protein FlgB